jgi:hypothetical protein
MVCPIAARPSNNASSRRTLKATLLGASVLSGVLLAPGAAHAELEGLFAEVLDVDTGYVTGVNGATDIAWSGERAVITTKNGTLWIRGADGTKKQQMGLFGTVDTEIEKGRCRARTRATPSARTGSRSPCAAWASTRTS